MGGAEVREAGVGVEGVQFDLVDGGFDAGVGGEEFGDLDLRGWGDGLALEDGGGGGGEAKVRTCFSPKLLTPPLRTSPSWIASSTARQLSSRACLPP